MAKNRPKPKRAEEIEYEEVKDRLNDRVLAFIEFYLICWNGTKAAELAGYSKKTAQEQSSRLLSNVIVQAAIHKRLKDLQAESNEVITRLTDHARANIELFLDDDNDLDLAVARRNNALGLAKKVKCTRRTEPRKDQDPVIITTLEIELHDAQAAIVQLAKIRGLFVDKDQSPSWESEIIKLLRDGTVTQDRIRKELPDDASRLIIAAGLRPDDGAQAQASGRTDAGRGRE